MYCAFYIWMPPKSSSSSKTAGAIVAGATPIGRKPMKTALLSSVQSQDEILDDKKGGGGGGGGGGVAIASVAAIAASASSASTSVSDIDKISRNRSSEELKYLAGLSLLEQKVCMIAQDHLESSFDLERSSGFIAWKNCGWV
jgi:hypothetical protein